MILYLRVVDSTPSLPLPSEPAMSLGVLLTVLVVFLKGGKSNIASNMDYYGFWPCFVFVFLLHVTSFHSMLYELWQSLRQCNSLCPNLLPLVLAALGGQFWIEEPKLFSSIWKRNFERLLIISVWVLCCHWLPLICLWSMLVLGTSITTVLSSLCQYNLSLACPFGSLRR